ncbi:SLC13 family permease [Tepidibacillus sp. HK-1]|uniref:SLC13 family permease n=1 Tax=Tepidibacillus sp. HK-1 TaxID=1883407 RepID=UPI000852F96D|nr:SLC13 family permease [Tepidibacillus sp. HK-1]GBF12241.1 sodium-dependent dicarboxylate transporter SdcS [Tepidibacillus sp. HK-1]
MFLFRMSLPIALSLMVGLIMLSFDLPIKQVLAASILVLSIVGWTTEIVAPAVVSLGIISLFVIFGVLDLETATSGFSSGVIWLLLAVSILGFSLEKSGLVDRMARIVVRLGGGNVPRTFLVMLIAIFVVTVLVPTAVARAGLVVVLANGIIRAIGSQYAKSVSLMAVMSVFALQLSVITGTNGTLYLVAYLETHGPTTMDYLTYMGLMAPLGIGMGLTVWLLIVWKFKLFKVKLESLEIDSEQGNTLSGEQWRVITISIITLIIWMVGPWLHINIHAYTLFLVVLLLLPGVGGISWEETKKVIPWGTLLLFGGALALGYAVRETGLAERLAGYALYLIKDAPLWLIVIEVILFFLIGRIIFVNLLSLLVTILPIILLVGSDIGWNPVWLVMLGLVAGSSGYLVPAQSPVALIMLGERHTSESELMRIGFILLPVWSILVVIAAFTYWPLLGMSPSLTP